MKAGDKVMLKSSSRYHSQAPNIVGAIVEHYPGHSGWVVVRWNQEKTPKRPDKDNYPMEDLILATKLHYLLTGLDTEDNAVYNKAEGKT